MSMECEILEQSGSNIKLKYQGKVYQFELMKREGNALTIKDQNGKIFKTSYGELYDHSLMVVGAGHEIVFKADHQRRSKSSEVAGGLIAPMPGKIFKVLKAAGDAVKKGETILILEAMKMEHSIKADKDGKVKKIHFKVGDQVQGQAVLAEID
jgi:biotin carboxyl carrier protein